MAQLFRNNAFSTVGASLTNVGTTLTVATGHGDRFPVVAAPDFMLLTLQDASNNIEIVRVTARTSGSDSMTIQRAQEGTSARAWNIGDVVELRLTASALNPLSLLEGASTAAAIRSALGATSVGNSLFTAADASAARGAIGATTVGDAVLTAADAAAARTALGATSVGNSLFTAADASAARAAIGAGTGDVTLTGAQSISGKTVFSFGYQFNAGNSGTSVTVNFANGQKQILTLTGNATVTLSFPGVGNYQILLVQDATGNRTVTWSGVTRWVGSATAPAINTAANSSTVVSIYYDGTNVWLGASKVNA